jgi:hypothetical protein
VDPGPIIVSSELNEDPAQVCLAKHYQVVDAFATDRSDQPLGEAILPRRAWGNGLIADAQGT